jgi:glycosyltransferase involved in cell wall biosynthesis
MKVFYLLSNYVSHYKAGREYLQCLAALGVNVVEDLESADIVIIHDEPPTYQLYFNKFPALKEKYTIGYAVWETDILPESYIKGLRLVNEIWTCSKYTYNIFKKHFDHAYIIPHVVPKYDAHPDKVIEIRNVLNYDADKFYFYTIADSINPRKNLLATLYCFMRNFPALDDRVFLVVKQYRKALPYLSSIPNVITINEFIDDEYVKALHAVCDCYISSHCAEAWGLSISDAMSFGKLVIATGYSGNMEYMNNENSFPVKYRLDNIREEDLIFQQRLLHSRMQWAYIDVDDLGEKMKACYQLKDSEALQANAQKITKHYSHIKVANIMMKRLGKIASTG